MKRDPDIIDDVWWDGFAAGAAVVALVWAVTWAHGLVTAGVR